MGADPAGLRKRIAIAERTLSKRAVPGMFVYPALCLGYAFVCADARSLHTTIAITAVMLVIAVVRLAFHLTSGKIIDEHPTRWRWMFAGLALLSILVWDGFVAFELYSRDLDAASIVLVVASSGLRAGASYSLSPDLRLFRFYSLVSRLPVLATLVVLGGPIADVLFVLQSIQTAYALLLGKQLNAEFWTAIATHEKLAEQNRTLAEEFALRERMELELRLAQKLEAVGRLAAGIAHEINTPLQSVSSSLHFGRDGVQELLAAVAAYRAALVEVGAAERLPALDCDADLSYLVEHLPGALELALEGTNRAASIVRSIKEFAHPDGTEMTPIDLNRALDSTLAIARNEYTAVADVETELAELPLITCHAGELNQVFLSLIVNAAHAMEAPVRLTGKKGHLKIRTRVDHDDVVVSVSDTGGGIPAEIRSRVFDPFFTTKDVGHGTGQGLAIARSVVHHHHGEITFDTEVGRGTTFHVRIPIHRPARNSLREVA